MELVPNWECSRTDMDCKFSVVIALPCITTPLKRWTSYIYKVFLILKAIKAKALSTSTTFKSHPQPVIAPSYRGREGAWNEVTLHGISELSIQWRMWSRARQPVDCWTYDLHRMSTVTLETSMSRSRTFKVNDSTLGLLYR